MSNIVVNKKVLIIGLGYIGTAIYDKLKHIYDIDSCDINNDLATYKLDCFKLSKDILEKYNIVIYLAGNSSVGSCNEIADTLNNNVYAFDYILNTIVSINNDWATNPIKVIYASSASVYGTGLGVNPMQLPSKELHPIAAPINFYDGSKQICDIIANMYSNQLEIYGLRFGTVNGYSPKMRWDLIINSMYKSAMESGVINVVNPNIHRAILFIDDLVDAMQAIIDKNDGNGGIYNIASFNDSIGNIAEYVSSYIDKSTKIITSFQPSVYDFCVSCSKFNNNIKPILFNRTPEQTTELIIKSIANEY